MDDERDDTKSRRSRNLSEKKRRDQFNMLVSELSSIVSTNTRKMDKSTVLKSTILFLKNHNELKNKSLVHEIQENWKPSFLSNEEFTHLTLEALDGFIMVFATSGRILYASESITSLLGHLPDDLLNTTIFELAFENDRPSLFNLLRISSSSLDNPQEFGQDNQFSFTCHLKRGTLDFREEPSYEVIHFVGYFRYSNAPLEADELMSNNFCLTTSGTTRLIFVATGRLQIPQLIREMSVVDSSNGEFTSRHSLEWKFLFLDHKAPPIIGYLPFEVLGTSGYDYYHFDDLEKVVACHEALIEKGEGTSCYYRFLTKGQQWIWLQSRFYITYHQWSSKPEFVFCTHSVASYSDVLRQLPKESNRIEEMSTINMPSDQMSLTHGTKYFREHSPQPHHSTAKMSEGVAWSHSSQSSRHSMTGNMSQCESATSSRHTGPTHNAHLSDNPIIGSVNDRHSDTDNAQRSHHHCNLNNVQCTRKCHTNMMPQEQPPLMVQPPIPIQQDLRLQPASQSSLYLESPLVTTVPLPTVIQEYSGQAVLPSAPVRPAVQAQLEKKHEELQQMIISQQEELRRVSEQLAMARYGFLPPLMNVPVPYSQSPPGNIITTAEGLTLPLHAEIIVPQAGPSQMMPHRNDQPNHQVHMHDMHTYVPMQMSQQQAQLLFNSENDDDNISMDSHHQSSQ